MPEYIAVVFSASSNSCLTATTGSTSWRGLQPAARPHLAAGGGQLLLRSTRQAYQQDLPRTLAGQPHGREVTTRFIWEGARLLQEIQNEVPLTYVYSDQHSHEPLARIDGVNAPDIFWFHNQPNGTPERLTDAEGKVCWKGQNSAWGKLLHERDAQLAAVCPEPVHAGPILGS